MHYYNSKFTIEEDEIIIREVRTMPSNLSKCFVAASSIIDKTPAQVKARWYNVLRNDTFAFDLQSNLAKVTNRKNYPLGDREFKLKTISLEKFKETPKSVFSKVKSFFINLRG